MAATILVVDDDDALTEALRAVLESDGYAVRAAANAQDGLAEALRERPDLAILDVMLGPGEDGLQLARRFRAEEQLRDVPIIMMTAIHERVPYRFSPHTDGDYLPVQSLLEKPVAPRVLLREVAVLLGREVAEGSPDD